MKQNPREKVKTALITGGARRIGAALVKAFHQKGMNVLFQYHTSADSADALIRSLNGKRPDSVAALSMDLEVHRNYQILSDEVIRHFGGLDLLVNNASAFFPTSDDQPSDKQWNHLLNVNAKAPFFISQHCKKMLKQRRGSIINITDIYAKVPLAEYAIYCASKAALANLTLSMAASFAPDIRVNAIAPGAILAPEGTSDDAMNDLIGRTPLRRLGGVASIVETALFLANQASFITGQTINVDGGRTVIAS